MVIVAIDLDIPIGFVLDDRRGGLRDAIQTPGLYSFGFSVIDAAWRIKQFGVENDETEVVLVMGVE